MNKTIATILLITSIFLTGCIINQKKQIPIQLSETVENNIFNHDLFSINLPAPYIVISDIIRPKNENAFPQIIFSITNEPTAAEKLLETERVWFKNLCGQTDACGKITSSETVQIDGKNGIKFTVEYQGRGLDDRSGYLNEYHYSTIISEKLFRFWSSASDLENPEKVSEAFDKIINTIIFKK